jgi:hypothetical protein
MNFSNLKSQSPFKISIQQLMRRKRSLSANIFAAKIISICIAATFAYSAFAQTADEEFGKNRVQFHDFNWTYYKSERFSVYFYFGGQDLGKFVIQSAEKEIEDVENKMEYELDEPIEILVFNNLYDLKQSNIGYGIDFSNTGGITRLVGNKMFVYFDGNHQHLLEQVRAGIAGIIFQNLMYGNSVQEILQNAVLLRLPEWFKDGFISYMGESWNASLDNVLRDGVLTGKFKNINKLTGLDAEVAGHAIWSYIADRYGTATIPNLLYLTRINRSMESAFKLVLQKSSSGFVTEWFDYSAQTLAKDTTDRDPSSQKNIVASFDHRKSTITQIQTTPDASKIGYVKNDLGKYKICVRDVQKKKSKTLKKGGYRNMDPPIDYSQPVIAIDPSGKKLAAAYFKSGKRMLGIYDLAEKKWKMHELADFQQILSMSFTDPNSLAISAEKKGQSDLFLLHIKTFRLDQLTNDAYDDLNPRYISVDNRQGIAFVSNRPNDTIRNVRSDTINQSAVYDLFFYNLKTKSKVLSRISHTRSASDDNAINISSEYFAVTSDLNGIANRYYVKPDSFLHHYDQYYFFPDSTVINPKYGIDSVVKAQNIQWDSVKSIPVYKDTFAMKPVTDYPTSIIDQETAQKKERILQLQLHAGKYILSFVPILPDSEVQFKPVLANTIFAQQRNKLPTTTSSKNTLNNILNSLVVPKDTATKTQKPADTIKAVQPNTYFESEFSGKPVEVFKDSVAAPAASSKQPLHFTKVLPYSPKFSTDYVVTQLDNSLIISRYQPFSANNPQFDNPDLSGFLKIGISDLMEDYHFEGGFRIPVSLDGTEYYFKFEDLKHRLDKIFTVYRKATEYSYTPDNWYLQVTTKQRTYLADATFRYPLDFTKSLRFSVQYRNERSNYLATDSFSLHIPALVDNYLTVHGEFVIDNTQKIQTNIYRGLRMKIYGDASRILNQHNSYLFAAGGDAREYVKLSRNLIWASRLQGATSFGDQKVVYFIGGTESWLFPTFSNATPINPKENYAFQTLGTDLRGFDENARNGNSYAMFNTEIRFPVFTYFVNTPMRSNFINNFQLVGFFDAGTAWEGTSPFDRENPFNTEDITQGPVMVHVEYFREPIIYGYGLGLRTTILGYFVRVDYAQGVDSGVRKKPIWYFSLGTDF